MINADYDLDSTGRIPGKRFIGKSRSWSGSSDSSQDCGYFSDLQKSSPEFTSNPESGTSSPEGLNSPPYQCVWDTVLWPSTSGQLDIEQSTETPDPERDDLSVYGTANETGTSLGHRYEHFSYYSYPSKNRKHRHQGKVFEGEGGQSTKNEHKIESMAVLYRVAALLSFMRSDSTFVSTSFQHADDMNSRHQLANVWWKTTGKEASMFEDGIGQRTSDQVQQFEKRRLGGIFSPFQLFDVAGVFRRKLLSTRSPTEARVIGSSNSTVRLGCPTSNGKCLFTGRRLFQEYFPASDACQIPETSSKSDIFDQSDAPEHGSDGTFWFSAV